MTSVDILGLQPLGPSLRFFKGQRGLMPYSTNKQLIWPTSMGLKKASQIIAGVAMPPFLLSPISEAMNGATRSKRGQDYGQASEAQGHGQICYGARKKHPKCEM